MRPTGSGCGGRDEPARGRRCSAPSPASKTARSLRLKRRRHRPAGPGGARRSAWPAFHSRAPVVELHGVCGSGSAGLSHYLTVATPAYGLMPSDAIVSVAAFCASSILPSLHIFVICSTFCRALWLASSTRTPTSALILATSLSQSPIGCCAITEAESHAREIRAKTTVIVRVMSSPPPCVRSAQTPSPGAIAQSFPRWGNREEAAGELDRRRRRGAVLSGTERANFGADEFGNDDAGGARSRREDRGRLGTDRVVERIVQRRRDVDIADGLSREVPAPEREHDQERHQDARRETTPVGLRKECQKSRKRQRHRPFLTSSGIARVSRRKWRCATAARSTRHAWDAKVWALTEEDAACAASTSTLT